MKILEIHSYYDGVLSGLCETQHGPRFFSLQDTDDVHAPWVYDIHDLDRHPSDEEWKTPEDLMKWPIIGTFKETDAMWEESYKTFFGDWAWKSQSSSSSSS